MAEAFPLATKQDAPIYSRKQMWSGVPGSGAVPLPNINPVTTEIKRQPVPVNALARISGFGEQINLSSTLDTEKWNAILRTAERGDTWQLFTIYRDAILNDAHIKSVWAIRKMAVVGQPHTLIPHKKGDKKSELAVKIVNQMIDKCDNWMEGIMQLLNAQLYPVSAVENLFRPSDGDEEVPVRFLLRELFPINELLYCYKIPYMPQPIVGTPGYPTSYPGPEIPNISAPGNNPAAIYNPDRQWPDLTFYDTLPSGFVNRTTGSVYAPDPMRHIIHKGNTMSPSIRGNYGGELRSIIIWWFYSCVGRDAFANFMERYGSPIPILRADMQQADTVQFLTQAMQRAYLQKVLILDKNTTGNDPIDKLDVKTESSGQAFEGFLNFCQGQITRQVLGQELSHTAKPTGLGSGVAALQGQVRDDIRLYDQVCLNHTLKKQLFRKYLDLNGYNDCPTPGITWSGVPPEEIQQLGTTLKDMSAAGLEPDDNALDSISEKVGFRLRRKAQVNGADLNTEPDGDEKTDDKKETVEA